MTTWNLNGTHRLVLLCNGDSCSDRGGDAVTVTLRREIAALGLDPAVHTARTRCLGRCDDGCTVVVQPDNVWYRNVTPDFARRLVQEHLHGDAPVLEQVSFLPGTSGLRQVSGVYPGVAKPQRETER
ncbi:MAG: (2Fe-2S) ferredoxin domain-containing protein [Gemmatimonas sp.]|uniref:(2Fe-2S) ferredoxin domain-containing protein n=1 Tax=Gemmatimonas sp. TaxID=1962908 RepID=UPI00391EFF1B